MKKVRSFRLLCLMLLFLSNSPAFSEEAALTPDCPVSALPAVNFPEIFSSCIANRRQTQNAVELVTQDVRVCECLNNPKENPLFRPDETPIQSSEKTPSVIQRRAQTFANSSALQSISTSSSKRDAEVSLMTNGTAEVRQKLKENPRLPNEATPTLSKLLTRVNQISEERANRQCVTYMEYSANREVPYDNNFFKFLQQTTSFNQDDWKIESLSARFDLSTNPDEKRLLYSRMTFLSRNPQYASLFRAVPGPNVTAESVQAKKVELFNIIKTLAPPASSTCNSSPNQCWREAQTSGAYGRFSASAGQFLRRNDVTDLVSAQASADYISEIERLSRLNDPNSEIPLTPNGYSNYLQSSQRDLAFGCAGSSATAECYQRFSEHCQRVQTIHLRAKSAITGSEAVRELRSEEELHSTLDPENNMSFEAFNDLMCLQNFRNAAGESSNFFAYRDRVCPAGSTNPECSDRRQILKRFLEEYNVSGVSADENIRLGFASNLSRADFVSITETQLRAINNITERPAELRARFGGGYPTISPQGTLVPYSATPTPQRTSVASNTITAPIGSAEIPQVTPVSQATSTVEPSRRRTEESANRFNPDDDSQGDSQPVRQRTVQRPAPSSFRSTTPFPSEIPSSRPQVPSTVSNSQTVRAPASVSNSETTVAPTPGRGGGSVAPSSGGDSTSSVQPSPTRTALTEPVVELPRRRSRPATGAMNSALLDANENVSETPVSDFQRQLVSKPPVQITTRPEVIQALIDDPNSLAEITEVLDVVNRSTDNVVKLSLKSGANETPVIVYAQKINGAIQFAFTPPPPPTAVRQPAALGNNEMNVKLQGDIYITVSANPALLSRFQSVVAGAMSLPGDVVRVNIVSEGKDPVVVFLDKRGSAPVFTLNDQSVIRAYKP